MRTSIALLSAIALHTGRLIAQETVDLEPGARIRISSADGRVKDVTGVVTALRGDSLVVKRERNGETIAVSVRAIGRLDVSVGRHSHGWAGAGIGLVGGAALGSVLGYAAGDDPRKACSDTDCLFAGLDRYTAREKAAGGAIALGIVGTIAGAIVGHHVTTDRWRPLIAPRPSALAIGFRGLAF
jgi:hypothetical protein